MARASLLALAIAVSVAHAAEGEFSGGGVGDATATGYRVGDTGLWIGGYNSVELEVPQSGPAKLDIADLGLLARYEIDPSLAFFGEVELDDTASWIEGEGVQRGSRILLLERLYLDWAVRPDFTVRFGKVLTPFGIWNVVRRAPLTWTVDRPVATQSAFPDHTTGLSLIYQTTRHGWSVDATAYGQAQDELVRGASDISASAVGGARAVASRAVGPAYVAFGLSGIAFKDVDVGLWKSSYGSDFEVTAWGNQLMGELAVTQTRRANPQSMWSAYLQDVVPLYGGLYGVVRLEHIAPAHGPAIDGQLVGLAWRLGAHVVVKTDYQFVNREGNPAAPSALERGFVASVTIYF